MHKILKIYLNYIQLCMVFSMISSSADALNPSILKVFNGTSAHSPWNICNEVFDWPLQFFRILCVIVVHVVFAVSPQKESHVDWGPENISKKNAFIGNFVSSKLVIEVSHRNSCRVRYCDVLLKPLTLKPQILTTLQ